MDHLTLVVLRALFTKRGWYGLSHLVSMDTFMHSEARLLYKALDRMHGYSEHDVTPDALKADIEVTYQKNKTQREGLVALVELIDETPEIPEDQLTSLVKRFIELSTSHKIVEYIASNAEQEGFDATVVEDLIARAVEVSGRVDSTVTDIFETSISGSPGTRPVRHGTGISRELDVSLRGGVGAGELLIYLGGPGTGKSSLLCKSGAAHAQEGGGVLHVTLEINTTKVVYRYDQAWTGLSQEEIEAPEGQEKAALCRQIVKERGGHVWFLDWAYMPVTANDVGAQVRKMRAQGMNVSMIIIDYLGLMKPNKVPGREYRQQFSAVGQEMRQLARNLNIPVLTGWQVNREGSKKTGELLSEHDVSESWDIIMIADQIIGINQNRAQKELRRMVLNVIKQRESTDRSAVTIYCDMDRLNVRDLRKEDHDAEMAALADSAAPGTYSADAA